MGKQELVSLHRELRELARGYGMDAVRPGDFEHYRSLRTAPLAIHESIHRHAAAVSVLSQAVTASMRAEADRAEI